MNTPLKIKCIVALIATTMLSCLVYACNESLFTQVWAFACNSETDVCTMTHYDPDTKTCQSGGTARCTNSGTYVRIVTVYAGDTENPGCEYWPLTNNCGNWI